MNTIEIKIRDYLVSKKIFPFSVLFMKDLNLLKISFYLEDDIKEFLEISGHDKMCDNFGYRDYKDTILVFGSYLTNFLRDVGCSELY